MLDSISEKLSKISDIKRQIRLASNAKGAGIASMDLFEAYPKKISNIPESFLEYSSEETKIGIWIDGKPIYRRVFESTFGSSTDSPKTIADASDWDIDTVTNLYGISQDYSNITGIASDGNVGVFIDHAKNLAVVTSMSSVTGKRVIVVVEYTKTTDEVADEPT